MFVGHLKKLEFGIKAIEHPSARDRAIAKAKEVIQGMPKGQLQSDGNPKDKEEFTFWNRLIEKCLKPDADQYNKVNSAVNQEWMSCPTFISLSASR